MSNEKERVAIKGLALEIGKKKIELSIEEAQKVHQALDAIFGSKTIIIEQPIVIPQPKPMQPINPWTQPWNS